MKNWVFTRKRQASLRAARLEHQRLCRLGKAVRDRARGGKKVVKSVKE
jgi:hypothetical protein